MLYYILLCGSLITDSVLTPLITLAGVGVTLILGVISERRNQANIRIEQQKRRPLLIVGYSDFESKISIYLKNKGAGPLLIKNYYLEKIGNVSMEERKDGIFAVLPPILINYNNYTGNQNGIVLSPKEKKNLLRLVETEENKVEFAKARVLVRGAISKYKIVVEYNDVYDVSMPKYERSLEWFGRHPKENSENN